MSADDVPPFVKSEGEESGEEETDDSIPGLCSDDEIKEEYFYEEPIPADKNKEGRESPDDMPGLIPADGSDGGEDYYDEDEEDEDEDEEEEEEEEEEAEEWNPTSAAAAAAWRQEEGNEGDGDDDDDDEEVPDLVNANSGGEGDGNGEYEGYEESETDFDHIDLPGFLSLLQNSPDSYAQEAMRKFIQATQLPLPLHRKRVKPVKKPEPFPDPDLDPVPAPAPAPAPPASAPSPPPPSLPPPPPPKTKTQIEAEERAAEKARQAERRRAKRARQQSEVEPVQITPVLPTVMAAVPQDSMKAAPPVPAEPCEIGKCGFSGCRTGGRVVMSNDEVVEVRCTEQRYCNIFYHVRCWRAYEKEVPSLTTPANRSKVSCPTPDCPGFILFTKRTSWAGGDKKEHVSEFRKKDQGTEQKQQQPPPAQKKKGKKDKEKDKEDAKLKKEKEREKEKEKALQAAAPSAGRTRKNSKGAKMASSPETKITQPTPAAATATTTTSSPPTAPQKEEPVAEVPVAEASVPLHPREEPAAKPQKDQKKGPAGGPGTTAPSKKKPGKKKKVPVKIVGLFGEARDASLVVNWEDTQVPSPQSADGFDSSPATPNKWANPATVNKLRAGLAKSNGSVPAFSSAPTTVIASPPGAPSSPVLAAAAPSHQAASPASPSPTTAPSQRLSLDGTARPFIPASLETAAAPRMRHHPTPLFIPPQPPGVPMAPVVPMPIPAPAAPSPSTSPKPVQRTVPVAVATPGAVKYILRPEAVIPTAAPPSPVPAPAVQQPRPVYLSYPPAPVPVPVPAPAPAPAVPLWNSFRGPSDPWAPPSTPWGAGGSGSPTPGGPAWPASPPVSIPRQQPMQRQQSSPFDLLLGSSPPAASSPSSPPYGSFIPSPGSSSGSSPISGPFVNAAGASAFNGFLATAAQRSPHGPVVPSPPLTQYQQQQYRQPVPPIGLGTYAPLGQSIPQQSIPQQEDALANPGSSADGDVVDILAQLLTKGL